MRRGSLLPSKELLADCLEDHLEAMAEVRAVVPRGGEPTSDTVSRVVRPTRTAHEEAQRYAQAAAGGLPEEAEGGGSAGELVDLARPRFRQAAVYSALSEALLRACGGAAKVDAP